MYPDTIFKMPLVGSEVNMYGISIAVGLIVCIIMYYVLTKYKKINSSVQDFVFFTAIVAIAGGFVFAKFAQAIFNLIETGVFDFENAGITVMSGLLGGAGIFLLVYFGIGKFYFKGENEKIHIKQFNHTLVVAPACIAVAHAFGRIGCLFAGCCHGYETVEGGGGLWMHSPTGGWGYYFPAQLYEAIFLFVLFGVLTFLVYKKSNITHAVYLIAYGVWRFIIEFFRGDERGGFILGLSPSQWTSIIFILLGVAILLFFYFKKIPYVLKDVAETSGVQEPEIKEAKEPKSEEVTENNEENKN